MEMKDAQDAVKCKDIYRLAGKGVKGQCARKSHTAIR